MGKVILIFVIGGFVIWVISEITNSSPGGIIAGFFIGLVAGHLIKDYEHSYPSKGSRTPWDN